MKGNWLFSPQKLHERQSVFERRVYTSEDKGKWLKVLEPDMMSSEESDEEDPHVNLVKIVPLRADVVQDFLYDLDDQYYAEKSAKAKRQTKRRVFCDKISTRPLLGDQFPKWATC